MRQQLVSLLDLTYLGDDTEQTIITQLCQQAQTPVGPVAAVCVYPRWIQYAKALLADTTIAVATVINFPRADNALGTVLHDITMAIAEGADELDVVLPYQRLHDTAYIQDFLQAVREQSQAHCLKIIIESGELTTAQIQRACALVCQADANFIKTSTGKTAHGASLNAVSTITTTIAQLSATTGIKVSGGVNDAATASQYLTLIHDTLGAQAINPNQVRFGASKLLNDLLKET